MKYLKQNDSRLSLIMAIMFILIAIIYVLGCGNKEQSLTNIKPFSTTEWKHCFDDCISSFPGNIEGKIYDSEKKEIELNLVCVNFCTTTLRRKRNLDTNE
ncbi:MAG TPA: hypothetical protein P5136_00200 [Methanofastidiosum sp.]|nr:hypothetical protein [Methanofastidiosum sp.]